MASSQQPWRRGSQLLLLAAVLALVLLVGFAAAGKDDWKKCPKGYADCDGKKHNGCEVYLYTDKYNCGYCGHKCEPHPKHWDWKPYCSGGECQYKCPHGWKYDSHKKTCYKDKH